MLELFAGIGSFKNFYYGDNLALWLGAGQYSDLQINFTTGES